MSNSDWEIRSLVSDHLVDPFQATDLEAILNHLGIHHREQYIGVDSKGNEILGAYKALGLRKLIITSPNLLYEARKRFTLAHEIGHAILNHKNSTCIATDFDLWRDKHVYEREANSFAAELLLPFIPCSAAIKKSNLTFELIEDFCKTYRTSLSATAIRLVRLDGGMTALVAHDGRNVMWKCFSPDCRLDICSLGIDPNCLAEKAKQLGRSVRKSVDPEIWCSENTEDLVCEEETRYFPNLKTFISIINIYEQ